MYFRLSDGQIQALDDDTFLQLAAKAYLMKELKAEIVYEGIRKILEELGG